MPYFLCREVSFLRPRPLHESIMSSLQIPDDLAGIAPLALWHYQPHSMTMMKILNGSRRWIEGAGLASVEDGPGSCDFPTLCPLKKG